MWTAVIKLFGTPTNNVETWLPHYLLGKLVGTTCLGLQIGKDGGLIFKKSLIGVIYLLLTSAVFAVSFYFGLEDKTPLEIVGSNFIAQITSWVEIYIACASVVIINAGTLVHRDRLYGMERKVQLIDSTLKEMNMVPAYRKTKLHVLCKTIVFIVLWATITIMRNITILFFRKVPHSPLYLLCTTIPTLVTGHLTIEFSSVLFVLQQRFDIINQLLATRYEAQASAQVSFIRLTTKYDNMGSAEQKLTPVVHTLHLSNSIDTFTNKKTISPAFHRVRAVGLLDSLPRQFNSLNAMDRVFKMHDILCELTKCINVTYGLQILIALLISFLTILSQIYLNVVQSKRSLFVRLVGATWTGYHCLSILLIVVSCCNVAERADRTRVILHRIRNGNNDIKAATEMYSLQLLHQNVQLTACGFFPLDFTLIYSVVGALTTYLVILIQFDSQTPKTVNATLAQNYSEYYNNLTEMFDEYY